MCGIAGISSSAKRDYLPVVHKMVASLGHRGPDASGSVSITRPGASGPECYLGNTRLSILDLSPAGNQPMRSEHTGNWIAWNGEIYNHLDVRKQLSGQVTHWNSTSDTETILRAFDVWGIDCVSRLRGMFAMALWDAAKGELWCVRDRLGIKPFYYFRAPQIFIFASEVRTLLESGLVPREADEIGLAGYVRFGSFPEPTTVITGVGSLPPAHCARVRAGEMEKPEPYWRIEEPQLSGIVSDPGNLLRRELERAVSEHLLSDVPVASFLSGGIDSSIVTAIAARNSAQPLRTYTVGFREAEYDESEFAEKVAVRYGTQHRKLLLSEDEVASEIPQGVDAMDLPSADGLNTWIVSKAVAADGVKVVLSGLGGDELFGGYTSFRLLPRMRSLSHYVGRLPSRVRALLPGGERTAQITRRGTSLEDRYDTLRALWSNSELRRMRIQHVVPYDVARASSERATLTRISIFELTGYMPSTLLRDSDAMSMSHSLELRVPFLDHELVEACLRLDAAGNGSKDMLIALTRDLLPEGIANRRKQGFVLPLERWMRGPLREFVRAGGTALERTRALPGVVFSDLLERFDRQKLNYARVWEFAVLGHWMERHKVQFHPQPPAPRAKDAVASIFR